MARRGTKSRKVTKKVSTSPRLCWLPFARPDMSSARSSPNMPRGPKGEKRPADLIGAAVMVGRIATGEIEEGTEPETKAAAALGKRGGKAGRLPLPIPASMRRPPEIDI